MLSPKKTKYRKMHRGRISGVASRNNSLSFGLFGLQAQSSAYITSQQIESARRVIARYTKRIGKIWIKIFPDKSITRRSADSRMGSGKGAVDHWVAVVKRGAIIFEIGGVSQEIAEQALGLASYKLSLKTRILSSKN